VALHMSEANLGGWVLAGDAMAEQLPPGSTIALGPAGYIPYVTGFRTWDFYGIIEPHIAHQDVDFAFGYPGHEKHDGAYIVSRRPDYILIGNVDITPRPRTTLIPPHVREVDIVRNKQFQAEYEQISLRVAGGRYLNLFRRKH
jgi:arabinofuranosyltransferase